MTPALDYYARIGAALFPTRAGSKAPTGIVGSFVRDCSADPAQWKAWSASNSGCNFGVVAGPSRVIICDIDVKRGRDAAWQAWCDLCASWGVSVAMPHVATPSGGWHVMFRVPTDVDSADLRQPDAIKGVINVRAGNGFTIAAGSTFEGNPYTLLSDAEPYPAPAALVEHCTRRAVTEGATTSVEYDRSDVAAMLRWMAERGAFEAYEDWLAAGMAIRSFDPNGIDLWLLTTWPKAQDAAASKWESFDTATTGRSVTVNSLMHRAHAMGWTGSVRKSAQAMFAGVMPHIVEAPSVVPAAPSDMIQSSGEFIGDFEPPDYVVDGIFQRRFCYSMTAQTGTGKTAIAMLLSASVATGRPLGSVAVERGTVLYFAGENPTDVRMRWLALTREFGVAAETLDVHFIPRTVALTQNARAISEELHRKGIRPMLVIVDTAAAYFEGDNDNDNKQQGDYARHLRTLTEIPGEPCVIVLAHPTKGASAAESMVPRGGGAFLNEMDGNVGVVREDTLLVAAPIGKFRGNNGWRAQFTLDVIRDHPRLKDTKGRPISTVVARAVREEHAEAIEKRIEDNADLVLRALPGSSSGGVTPTDVATTLKWFIANDPKQPAHTKVKRILDRLKREKLVSETLKRWRLTRAGEIELNRKDTAEQAVRLCSAEAA